MSEQGTDAAERSQVEAAVARLSMQVGVALFQAMLMRGVSFGYVAEHLGVSEALVRRWMVQLVSGRPGRTGLWKVAAIAHALDCELSVHARPPVECEV